MDWLSVDRIENGIAVCEDENRKQQEIALEKIEGTPRECDMLFEDNGKYHISEEETAKRREKILRLQKSLFGDYKHSKEYKKGIIFIYNIFMLC